MKRFISTGLEKSVSDGEGVAILSNFFRTVSRLTLFTGRFFKEAIKPPYEFGEFAKQCYLVGNKSFLLIAITAFIMGLVLTIQSRPVLAEFGAQSWLPAMVGVSIVREIGPVITALIFAGKVGSGIGAELSSMRVTEQIEAMEVSGINPYKYIVVTRILAATCMLPLLVAFADSVALYGSYFGINLSDTVSFQSFFFHVFKKLDFIDVFPAFIKTFFFGFFIGVISCYIGYNAANGTQGVGKAANSSVVFSSLMVFLLDMIAVQVTSFFI
ncbi:MAG TPA: ABC transporter permease [Bacteroidia bacterium]|jgi:phospholipid/cholesterol/gamma-HCH transport system permease protein|nr:ABC transporter permease [Bacteroidia bacterium]